MSIKYFTIIKSDYFQNMSKKYHQSHIGKYSFPRSSFFEGIARLLDFNSSLNQYQDNINIDQDKYHITANQKDAQAISSDWSIVSEDLESAVKNTETPIITDKLITQAHNEFMADEIFRRLNAIKHPYN